MRNLIFLICVVFAMSFLHLKKAHAANPLAAFAPFFGQYTVTAIGGDWLTRPYEVHISGSAIGICQGLLVEIFSYPRFHSSQCMTTFVGQNFWIGRENSTGMVSYRRDPTIFQMQALNDGSYFLRLSSVLRNSGRLLIVQSGNLTLKKF